MDLRREPSSSHVALGALSDQQVRALAGAWMKERAAPHLVDVVDVVAQSTQGNPLFAVEMLRHLDTRPCSLAWIPRAGTWTSRT